MAALSRWAFQYVGSTRPAALMRIMLAMILWYRFQAEELTLMQSSLPLGILLNVSAVGMLFGFQSRLCTFGAGFAGMASYYYLWVWKHEAAWAHHHTYVLAIAALLLSLSPCGRSFSVDRLLAVARARRDGKPEPREEGNLFALRLIAIQMACLYFFAFWDKTFVKNSYEIFYSFLNGARLEQILLYHYYGSDFAIQPWMSVIGGAAAVIVAVLELILPLLLIERFQKWLVIPGLGLHLAFYVLLNLQTYSITCMVLYLAILDSNKVAGVLELLKPQRTLRLTGGTARAVEAEASPLAA